MSFYRVSSQKIQPGSSGSHKSIITGLLTISHDTYLYISSSSRRKKKKISKDVIVQNKSSSPCCLPLLNSSHTYGFNIPVPISLHKFISEHKLLTIANRTVRTNFYFRSPSMAIKIHCINSQGNCL